MALLKELKGYGEGKKNIEKRTLLLTKYPLIY